jgi:hypothetical protein
MGIDGIMRSHESIATRLTTRLVIPARELIATTRWRQVHEPRPLPTEIVTVFRIA